MKCLLEQLLVSPSKASAATKSEEVPSKSQQHSVTHFFIKNIHDATRDALLRSIEVSEGTTTSSPLIAELWSEELFNSLSESALSRDFAALEVMLRMLSANDGGAESGLRSELLSSKIPALENSFIDVSIHSITPFLNRISLQALFL